MKKEIKNECIKCGKEVRSAYRIGDPEVCHCPERQPNGSWEEMPKSISKDKIIEIIQDKLYYNVPIAQELADQILALLEEEKEKWVEDLLKKMKEGISYIIDEETGYEFLSRNELTHLLTKEITNLE